jgi:hypothetical protein
MHSRVQINIGETLAQENFNNTSYSSVTKGVLKNIKRGISTYNLNFICALESKLRQLLFEPIFQVFVA